MKRIGVFDSGVGGLAIANKLSYIFPEVIYLKDTAHFPYGNKSKEAVIHYSLDMAGSLKDQGAEAIVIACGTASSFALSSIKERIGLPVVGVVEPSVRRALITTRNGRIGIIGTNGTIKSGSFEQVLKGLNPFFAVFSKACPLFVPLVEEGWFNEPETLQIAKKYLLPLKKIGIDTLILGCTHYPYLREVIVEVMGKEVALIDTTDPTVKAVEKIKEKGGDIGCVKEKNLGKETV